MKKKYDLPKNISLQKSGLYQYQKTLHGIHIGKSFRELPDAVSFASYVDDYIQNNNRLPNIKNDTVKYNYDTIVGERFGQLTAIDVVYINKKRMIRCACDCGKSVNLYMSDLIRKQRSCGHLRIEALTSEKNKEKAYETIRNSRTPRIDNHLKERNISYLGRENRYYVEVVRYKVRVRRGFKTLEKAKRFRDILLADIYSNGGVIPEDYLKGGRK